MAFYVLECYVWHFFMKSCICIRMSHSGVRKSIFWQYALHPATVYLVHITDAKCHRRVNCILFLRLLLCASRRQFLPSLHWGSNTLTNPAFRVIARLRLIKNHCQLVVLLQISKHMEQLLKITFACQHKVPRHLVFCEMKWNDGHQRNVVVCMSNVACEDVTEVMCTTPDVPLV